MAEEGEAKARYRAWVLGYPRQHSNSLESCIAFVALKWDRTAGKAGIYDCQENRYLPYEEMLRQVKAKDQDWISIHRAPGICCPEPSCDYHSHDWTACKGCGKKCKGCKFDRQQNKEQ